MLTSEISRFLQSQFESNLLDSFRVQNPDRRIKLNTPRLKSNIEDNIC